MDLELLRKIIQVAVKSARQVTDDKEALEVSFLYKEFDKQIGRELAAGEFIQYNDVLYKVLQAHTAQEHWTPDITPSLFAKVLVDPTGENILEYEAPDSTNPYQIGDKVLFEGQIYECIIANCVWSPSQYPSAWKLI